MNSSRVRSVKSGLMLRGSEQIIKKYLSDHHIMAIQTEGDDYLRIEFITIIRAMSKIISCDTIQAIIIEQ